MEERAKKQHLALAERVEVLDALSAEGLVPGTGDVALVKPFHRQSGSLIAPSKRAWGDVENPLYREAIRSALESLAEKRPIVTPFMVLQVVVAKGHGMVSEADMNSAFLEIAPIFGLEPVDMVYSGRKEIVFKKPETLLEAVVMGELHDLKDADERVEILGPNSYRVLSEAELRHKRRNEVRQAEEYAADVERELNARLRKFVTLAVAGSFMVTTKSVLKDIVASGEIGEEIAKDPDGKLKKKIAEVLKELGFTPRETVIQGKKSKVFYAPEVETVLFEVRSPAPLTGEPDPPPPAEEASSWDEEDEITTPQIFMEGPVGQEVEDREETPSAPAEAFDRTKLPSDWIEHVKKFVGASSGRSFFSLEEVAASMGRNLLELPVWSRGQIAKKLHDAGFITASYKERKAYHLGPPPSPEELAAFFREADDRVTSSMMAGVTGLPPNMTDKEKRDFAFLENAVLLLSDDGFYPRPGLFSGHPDVGWQNKVISRFQSEGLIVVSGQGMARTYSGSKPAIEQALERDYLLRSFWPHLFEDSEGEPEDEEQLEEEEEEEGWGQAAPEAEPVLPTMEDLVAHINALYGVLENHAATIGKLKDRIKVLENLAGVKRQGGAQ